MEKPNIPTDIDNIWRNVYWFARLLINTDQHAGFGADTAHVAILAGALRTVIDGIGDEKLSDAKLIEVLRATLRETLAKVSAVTTKRHAAHNRLAEALNNRIDSVDDFRVLLFTCEHVLIPTNALLDAVPSSDKEFTDIIGKAYLETQGEAGLATVINLWDDAGVQGSLTAERALVVNAFRTLRTSLSAGGEEVADGDTDHILTAFMQEIERRLGQKRKSRAGGSLEDVTSVILNHFNIPTTHKPDHFQADIEVDKWVKGSDGWLVGISCKRTLRERWKQVSSADSSILSKYKIKELWHVITYSNDLSEDKLVTLGAGRQVFYLPDDSPAFKTFSKHIGMKDYVRPMSNFISDLRALTVESQ